MPAFINLVGEKFGRLLVLEQAGHQGEKIAWLCECECGGAHVVTGSDLRTGHTKSCGCLRRDLLTTHGQTGTPEFAAWRDMRNRCANPNYSAFHNYGGRGIVVCDRWLHDFQAFHADMGPRPSGFTLERVDNSRGYSPDNCEWATWDDQARNRRDNRLLTYDGRTQCLMDWANEFALTHSAVHWRLAHGWSVERALTTSLGAR